MVSVDGEDEWGRRSTCESLWTTARHCHTPKFHQQPNEAGMMWCALCALISFRQTILMIVLAFCWRTNRYASSNHSTNREKTHRKNAWNPQPKWSIMPLRAHWTHTHTRSPFVGTEAADAIQYFENTQCQSSTSDASSFPHFLLWLNSILLYDKWNNK